jgi:hypothetical protein
MSLLALAIGGGGACGGEVTVVDGGGEGGGSSSGGAASGGASTDGASSGGASTGGSSTGGGSNQLCGGGLPPCPPDEFCDVPFEACDQSGACHLRPEDCPEDCPGVCGCDGFPYCNECIARASGVDVGPSILCAAQGDVVYAVAAWPGGLDHLILMRADFDAGTCTRVYLDAPAESAFDVTIPAPWGMSQAIASSAVDSCLDSTQSQAGELAWASGATGAVTWNLPPNGFYPCELSMGLTLAFDPAPAWLGPTVALAATDVPVDGGCF